MSILKAKKLQTRILYGYSAPLGILVLFAMLMGWGMVQQGKVTEERARANQVMFAIAEADIGVSRMLRTARGAMLFPGDARYAESFEKGRQQFEEGKSNIEEKMRDEKQLETWKEFSTEAEQLTKGAEEVLNLIQAGKLAEAKGILKDLEMTRLSELYATMDTRQEEILDEIRQRSDFTITLSWILIFVGLVGGTVGTLVLGTMISSEIAKEVKKAVTQITSSSAEIATSMEEQERTASLQAASVNETTTTMDELRASSHQSEEQAKSASQAAQEVLHLAENGNQSVEETVATMVDLKNKVAAIADQIVRLSEQTNQIGNISALVSDLSQQTNMLALNASVEAVRAGEHGKGFAVVAEEIRKLADQSRQSAANISNLVSDIQNAINTTVMVTDEGTKTVNAGMNITESTANAFAGVLEAINNVAMNNQQIVLNIRQQGKAVEQVLEAMDSINKGAQETAAGLTQVKAGTSQLSMTARELEAMV